MSAVKADGLPAEVLAELPQALRNGQVVAYFQPQIELSTGRVAGAESLVRWEHPELGVLSPHLIVPAAEQLGLTSELTRLMLRLSLAQQRRWAAAGHLLTVAVNAQPECVRDPDFPVMIAQCLRDENVPGQVLFLEVSEQTATASVSRSFFTELAELGVRTALDDFGTGFASLESLGGWPIDELKLDISLVRPMTHHPSFRTIVRTTIDLAHQLGMQVVAEGIETEAVRSELRALGCDFGQGFLLGRPMPADLFADWLLAGEISAAHRVMPAHRPTQAGGGAVTSPSGEPDDSARARLAAAGRRIVRQAGWPALMTAAAMLAAYGLWQIFGWGGHRHQHLIGGLAFFPVTGAAALGAWRASSRRELGPRTCRAWRLLSVALWVLLLGEALQLYDQSVLHARGHPGVADAACLTFYPIALAGVLSFPSRPRKRSEIVRLLLDMGTVVIGGATLTWYAALAPAVAASPGLNVADLVAFAYPVSDLLLLFALVALLRRAAPRSSVTALKIFAVSLAVFFAADVSYARITLRSAYAGGPVDTLRIVALIIMFLAASCQLRSQAAAEIPAPQPHPAAGPPVVPYLAAAVTSLLLMAVALRNVSFNPLGCLLVGVVLVTALVSARQFTELRDSSRLAARYAELASIDLVTGLYSRGHFLEAAEAAFAHARRLGLPLTVLMIDVDHFRLVNDVHGNAVGDQVLAEVGQACREQLGDDDIAGRYGGDEFVIMIVGQAARRAVQVAARLTRPLMRVTGVDGATVTFTVSVGVAEVQGCRDLAGLLARADQAMYEAKRAGGACYYPPWRDQSLALQR